MHQHQLDLPGSSVQDVVPRLRVATFSRNDPDPGHAGRCLSEQRESLLVDLRAGVKAHAGDVAAWLGEARHEPDADRITAGCHHNWDLRCRTLRSDCGRITAGSDDDVDSNSY